MGRQRGEYTPVEVRLPAGQSTSTQSHRSESANEAVHLDPNNAPSIYIGLLKRIEAIFSCISLRKWRNHEYALGGESTARHPRQHDGSRADEPEGPHLDSEGGTHKDIVGISGGVLDVPCTG